MRILFKINNKKGQIQQGMYLKQKLWFFNCCKE